MSRSRQLPVCLTLAGSDSGGGAGIQADLRAFADFHTFGLTVITAVTAQNPSGVTAIHPLPVPDVVAQYQALKGAFTIGSVKTGMLFSAPIIEALASELGSATARPPMVVDPVMVAASGARLLDPAATGALVTRLFPLATLVTPNLPEAEALLGQEIKSREDGLEATRQLGRQHKTAVLLKGGHADGRSAEDILWFRERLYALESSYVGAPTTHGTGCALSAAVAASLARGWDLLAAVTAAKAYVGHSLSHCCLVGPGTWARYTPTPRQGDPSTVKVTEL